MHIQIVLEEVSYRCEDFIHTLGSANRKPNDEFQKPIPTLLLLCCFSLVLVK